MDPAEGLARLERMGQRARERREKAEAEDRHREPVERVRDVRAELQACLALFLAGPPEGCAACYVWRRGKFGWHWDHAAAVAPAMRPVDDEWPDELCEWCTHFCHGPDGLALPIVALASC
jgi:hypothetical protein